MKNSCEEQKGAERFTTVAIFLLFTLGFLLATPSDVSGQSQAQENDEGSPDVSYAQGELLVTYSEEPEVSSEDEQIQNEVNAEVEEEAAELDAQLITFPEIKEERSENVQEDSLERKKAELEEDPGVESVDYNYVRKTLSEPKDPEFSRQWGLKKSGFPEAWKRKRGQGVDIAILDGGADARHPDLKDKVVAQKDFVDEDEVAEDSSFGHGTHVAGIAAASTGNRKGIAGGCPKCGIMVGKVVEYGEGYDFDIAEGIVWAVDEGAEVVNLSLGAPIQSDLLEEAILYAKEKDVLVVAAAGNFAPFGNPKIYPAAYPDTIAVAATNAKDKRDYYSSYGNWVDVAAPGVRIYSTLPGGKYGYDSGTSMAAPHVSALAGLLVSKGLQSSKVSRRIENTATDLGREGKDPRYGYGRINALAAVDGTKSPPAQNDPPNKPEPDRCTIKGTRGNDVLRGTKGRDVICGLSGSDKIYGRGGRDIIRGGNGNDILEGGGGDDQIYGRGGVDILKGGKGKDQLYGGKGMDILRTRDGRGGDLANGGSGWDLCSYDRRDTIRRCP